MVGKSLAGSSLMRCVITSSTSRSLDRDAFARLSGRYRRARSTLGVTGLMLYEDGNLFQLIEGQGDVLDNIYRSIGMDGQYRSVVKLLQSEIHQRDFSGCSAAYGVIGQQAFTCTESDRAYFLDMDEFHGIRSSKSKALVQDFVAGKWRLNINSYNKKYI